MRVLFLHRYGPQAASFRYRFEQYFPYFEKHGVEVLNQSFFSDEYLRKKFKGRAFLLFDVVRSYIQRLVFLFRLPPVDVIVLYKDALPYMPFFIEYFLILKRAPYIVDIDDALYVNYENSRVGVVRWLLGDKFKMIFTHAAHVFGGNDILASYAQRYNSNVSILPTVVDLNYYKKMKAYEISKKPLVIGWMGSPTSARGLVKIRQALKTVQDKYGVIVQVIGAGDKIDLGELKVTHKSWSLQSELDDLLEFDIGIMPLIDDDWDRGKCGFKLIQYMACGLAVVGSPVGVNQSIIDEGVNGHLAMSDEEWVIALTKMIENRAKLGDFGRDGREKVRRQYSCESAAPQFLQKLQQLSRGANA